MGLWEERALPRLVELTCGGKDMAKFRARTVEGLSGTIVEVGFGSGLYTDATGTGGARRAMKAAVTGGACNSCHDASNRIRAD